MNRIRSYSEKEMLDEAFRMLQSAHIVHGVQCQNCSWYKPDKDAEDYRGQCDLNERNTYWSGYCDDFEAKDEKVER